MTSLPVSNQLVTRGGDSHSGEDRGPLSAGWDGRLLLHAESYALIMGFLRPRQRLICILMNNFEKTQEPVVVQIVREISCLVNFLSAGKFARWISSWSRLWSHTRDCLLAPGLQDVSANFNAYFAEENCVEQRCHCEVAWKPNRLEGV